MGRSENLSQGDPQPSSKRLFPVGRQAIDNAQFLISSATRATATDSEISYINKNNEEFYSVLKRFFGKYAKNIDNKELKFYMHPFMDGAMFVHFAFRLQAEDQLPAFLVEGKRNDVEDIFQKEMNDISKFAQEKDIDEQELEIIAKMRIRTLANTNTEDSLLGQGIIAQSETFNDTRDGDTFLVGAMFAYDAIKRRFEDTEQEKANFALRQLEQSEESLATQEADTEIGHWDKTHPELADLDTTFEDIVNLHVTDEGPNLAEEVELFLRNRDTNGQQDAS